MKHEEFIDFYSKLKNKNLFKDYEKEISLININTEIEINNLIINTIDELNFIVGENIQCHEFNCFQKGIYSKYITTSKDTGLLISGIHGISTFGVFEKYAVNKDVYNIIKSHNKKMYKILYLQKSCLDIIKNKYNNFIE